MSSSEIKITKPATEDRLLEIRSEAERRGRVNATGVKPAGAPFPVASPETGYYGVPLLKEPQWSWEIPIYFFVGGAAGSAAIIGAVAQWIGHDERLAHDARFIAAGGAMLSSALLVSDLGRPERFLNMLRVLKPQSAMSVGAWVLAGFGTFSGAAALAELIRERIDVPPVRILGEAAQAMSAVFALPFSNYTGVLIGATAIPLWNHNIKTLPVHFGMSGLNSGVSILELAGHEHSRALNLLGGYAAAWETYEGFHLEMQRDPVINEPLKRGVSGWITRIGGVLSGPVPLALRLAAALSSQRRSSRLRQVAAWSSVAGSLLTRVGWVRAGHASARDWRIPLDIPRETGRDTKLQSRAEPPQRKAS